MGGLTVALCKGVALKVVSCPLEGLAHLVRCLAWIFVSSEAVGVGWSDWVGGVSFLDVVISLVSLAVGGCGFCRGSVSDIDAVGAGCICGFLIGRWSPDWTGKRSQWPERVWVGLCHL